MNKFKALSLLMILGGTMVLAQKPTHTQYVKGSPTGASWAEAYKNWTPGSALYNDANYDDEEFYISRVKPRARFTNVNTQVKKDLNSARKLLWWCPIGTSEWNAVPNYYFDSEVFSMWSYVDIYGNWTAPMIRVPAAFSDICHKNGVEASALDAIGWATTIEANDNGGGTRMKSMIDGGYKKLLSYLRQYGVDGIGYNSEFTIGSSIGANNLKKLLNDCFSNASAMNWPTFNNEWYSLMYSNGNYGGPNYLTSDNIDWFDYNSKPTSNAYFMNYGWGSVALGNSQESAKAKGRSSFDVYAGMNYQGESTAEWTSLKNYDISIGLWGAHDMNMIYEGRGELGASPQQKQKTYQLMSENSFTGSSYNPVNTPAITNKLSHTSTAKDFHGFSSFITARSSMTTTDLAIDPMVTYFNLGNGEFFNVQGKKQFPNQWYNIGIQDYLPTWRWWWTSSFMGRNATDVPATGLQAAFNWDDAWFGGSCLEISGKSATEYLQVFKTKYALKAGDQLLIRYKVLSGEGSMKWACSAEGDETTEVGATIDNAMVPSEDDVWVEKVVNIGTGRSDLKLADKTLALMGLKFENTSADFKVLIGEIALTRGTATTPQAPILKKTKMLASNYQGVDFKVIYGMNSPKSDDSPVYNSDVKTWMYKIYAQQEGGEPVMCTATTSWAAYVVSAPYIETGKNRMRVGVSALSLDGRSESEITWSDYLDIPVQKLVDGVEINKSIIKANEEFTVKYKDPNQPDSKWEITNAQTGDAVATIDGAKSITTKLANTGIYNLRVTPTGKDTIYNYYGLIQISSDEVGALPQIKTLQIDGKDADVKTQENTKLSLSYTGRPANGKVSRGLLLPEKAFGIPGEQLNFNTSSQFTISFWFNPVRLNPGSSGTQLLNIRSAQDSWPASDWGFVWSQISPDGYLSIDFRKQGNSGTEIKVPNFVFSANQWYHLSVVADFQNGSRVVSVYVNGKLIKTSEPFNDLYSWSNSNLIMIGGKAFSRAALDGYIDEVQLYNKALNQTEVINSMNHLTTIPESLIGYWDFENSVSADKYIYSTGTNKNLKAATYGSTTESEGVNKFSLETSNFAVGAPFISGTNYEVTTVPTWSTGKNSTLTEATGNDLAGKGSLTYSKQGTYSVKLTLTNGWGSDSKTFEYVNVAASGIEDNEIAAAYNAYPNPFINDVNVRFVKGGSYTIEVYDLAGKLLSSQPAKVNDGEFVNLNVNAGAGTYLINIKQGDKVMSALKVIKK